MSRAAGRGRRALVLAALLLGGLAFTLLYPADIRPDGLQASGPTAAETGRQRLDALSKVHGVDAWKTYQVMDVVFRDAWSIAPARTLIAPWGQPAQRLRGSLLTRSWTTVFEFLGGERDGEQRGLQSWHAWSAAPSEEAVFEPSWMTEVVLPGTRYFIEFPFSLLSASVVVDAGRASYEGKPYDRVFVSWDTDAPQRTLDQYLLWIDPDTGRLSHVDFTIRVLAGAAVARGHFRDYTSVGGVLVPAAIDIVAVLPTGYTFSVHTLYIEDVNWDTVPPAALNPNPDLVDRGEHKP